ncbi:entericidin A/B family lipoprotein [Henriciella mobilis]|uniref:Entericidin, EcnA/B family n=1 Tax=Henriciella mobilis TaxID=2305467 RepID=A0A399RQS5_9PROT|nr:entericidin A/B family lipoprotein [Henriciella mobilis]RIJ16011.1 entericidin, EcnA/B family [Henriciella mobilis]RIJ23077.1 entericidin, EcnA/B family [Henriciella mobilis]RIJ32614.1 entericidin, EcnA/B family [Henriciella mobilis]
MKKLILVFTALFALPVLSACNTISGIGKDVSAAGDVVSDTAESTKDKMD